MKRKLALLTLSVFLVTNASLASNEVFQGHAEFSNEQIKWLIRGTYLGAGSINNPEKKYHLEIGIAQKEDAERLIQYLRIFGIKSNVIEKGNQYTFSFRW